MERRTARVSPRQWDILIDFVERNPSLARARGYNNSAQERAESLRMWQEIADQLNCQGSGTTKTAKEWSIYVSNYKSKLKKIVADINANATATGGGPPNGGFLSELDQRFLAVMGDGFGQTNQVVRINLFPDMSQASISQSAAAPLGSSQQLTETVYVAVENEHTNEDTGQNPATYVAVENVLIQTEEQRADRATEVVSSSPTPVGNIPAHRRSRIRHRSRPLAPLDEARRILSEVEMQRAAADTAKAQALDLIGQSLSQLAEKQDEIGQSLSRLAESQQVIGQSLSRLADVADRYFNYISNPTSTQ